MKKQIIKAIPIPLALAALVLAGCGAEAPKGEPEAPADGPVASTQEAINEVNCAWAPRDAICTAAQDAKGIGCGASTADGNYGHPTCSNAFIVDFVMPKSLPYGTSSLYGYYAGPQPGQFPCAAAWVRTIIFNAIGSKISDETAYGVDDYPFSCQVYTNEFTAYAGQTYRVVAQAGLLYSYEAVGVAASP